MKRLYFFFTFVLIYSFSTFAQLNALFVNDNSVNEADTELIYGILEQYLGTLDYFDAVENERSPNFAEMSHYKLVIWYCGSDEDGLYFWNGGFEDNPNLEEYLDFGGSLWLMGVDFLNARYIKPPREFSEGNFLFDYLGIEKWSVEAYTDDNGMGVPVLLVDTDSPADPSLDSLNWENPPEPFVDGCKLLNGCYRTYRFGPAGYMLYGEPAAFYYPAQKFQNMTFTFDPARMDSKGNMSTLLSDILMFYEEILSGVEDITAAEGFIRLFPNPATDRINIEIESGRLLNVKLIDLVGNVRREKSLQHFNAINHQTSFKVDDLPGGIYFVRVETQARVYSKLAVIAH